MLGLASPTFSNEFLAIGDDRLKDRDNLGWLDQMDPHFRWEWTRRLRWVRWADRAAEEEMRAPERKTFSRFFARWQTDPTFMPLMREDMAAAPADAWRAYLEACAFDHAQCERLSTAAEYLARADRLSGSIFQLFPFIESQDVEFFRGLGAIDQVYNDLRDLHEDALQGRRHFPLEFDTRGSIARHVIETFLPPLKRALRFPDERTLHSTLQAMTTDVLSRYVRIESVYRACEFDSVRFHQAYWTQVGGPA